MAAVAGGAAGVARGAGVVQAARHRAAAMLNRADLGITEVCATRWTQVDRRHIVAMPKNPSLHADKAIDIRENHGQPVRSIETG
ncbi:MAG: hypothetical protein L0H23_05115 [Luteimonas sp.]|nr:hypothetical protein [Luteimonas sp.]